MTDENLFAYLGNIFTKSTKPSLQDKINNSFMVNRFLSMYPDSFFSSEKINFLIKKLPSWAVNYLFYYLVPQKNKVPYINYIKKEVKEKEDKKYEELLLLISEYFNCNIKNAKDIVKIIEKYGINIYECFGLKE